MAQQMCPGSFTKEITITLISNVLDHCKFKFPIALHKPVLHCFTCLRLVHLLTCQCKHHYSKTLIRVRIIKRYNWYIYIFILRVSLSEQLALVADLHVSCGDGGWLIKSQSYISCLFWGVLLVVKTKKKLLQFKSCWKH